MNIEKYSFGKMVIDGTPYTSDLIIYPERIHGGWWRQEGHLLQMEDLQDIIKEKPDILVVGTGYMGVMKVPDEIGRGLLELGIHLFAARTGKAVEIYNNRPKSKSVVAAFHLTC